LLLVPAEAQAAAPYEVLAGGLDNPRGISLRDGYAYVAEAGRGGDDCAEAPNSETGEVTTLCSGDTSGIVRISRSGRVEDVTTGWPSVAEENGEGATGVVDVSTKRGLYFLLGNIPGLPPELQQEEFGKLFRRKDGTNHERADISVVEETSDPDGEGVDSNPYGLFTTGGVRHLVVDAGGNTLLWVSRRDEVSLVAVLPGGTAEAPPFIGAPPGTQIPYQAVPTAVERGPDGDYYVGTLTGFPFPAGQAKVFRVTPDGDISVFADGFSGIIDVTFDNDGNLYVLEFATAGLLQETDFTGALWKVTPDGDRQRLSGPELQSPGGVAISSSGDHAYVTNKSVLPGAGEVLRYTL
jgi:hypothetical protein